MEIKLASLFDPDHPRTPDHYKFSMKSESPSLSHAWTHVVSHHHRSSTPITLELLITTSSPWRLSHHHCPTPGHCRTPGDYSINTAANAYSMKSLRCSTPVTLELLITTSSPWRLSHYHCPTRDHSRTPGQRKFSVLTSQITKKYY